MPETSHPCEQIEISCNSGTVDLLLLCLGDPQNEVYWSEFLRRTLTILGKLVRRASRMYVLPVWLQANDIVEDTVVKLLENNCALLRRFNGKSEDEFVVYLAVISRSCLVRHLRREAASKPIKGFRWDFGSSGRDVGERQVLAQEMTGLARHVLKEASQRDKLIFQLYFFEDLSSAQIARIQGIGLSPSGIKKVISGIRQQIVARGNLHHAGPGRIWDLRSMSWNREQQKLCCAAIHNPKK